MQIYETEESITPEKVKKDNSIHCRRLQTAPESYQGFPTDVEIMGWEG
jgi:hypothetical protein